MLCIVKKLSKQLDETISKVHAGKVVGGAIGKSFSYIDWIVYDKDVFMKVFNQLKKTARCECRTVLSKILMTLNISAGVKQALSFHSCDFFFGIF